MSRTTIIPTTLARVLAPVLFTVLCAAGCSPDTEPELVSREALGTVVTITAYGDRSGDQAQITEAIDGAYEAMAVVEAELDAHDESSAIARVNAAPDPGLEPLPPYAEAVLDAICILEVREWFSPQLWATTLAWSFETGGHIPSDAELDVAAVDPRYDLGGAAKGLALDEASDSLRSVGSIEAALISSGSTTLAFGRKPGGEPWRIGIEDPRDPEAIIATVEARDGISVSTSGDYQRYFERNGVRYHHVLDPATGRPASGLRSLTVVGDIPGLDSDILSTALFVAGPSEAIAYAEEHGLGLIVVDARGRTHVVPGPEDRTWEIAADSPGDR